MSLVRLQFFPARAYDANNLFCTRLVCNHDFRENNCEFEAQTLIVYIFCLLPESSTHIDCVKKLDDEYFMLGPL